MEEAKSSNIKNGKILRKISHRSVKVVFRRLPVECTREEFEGALLQRFGTSAEMIRFEKGKKKYVVFSFSLFFENNNITHCTGNLEVW